jgi:protein-tyrosine phosphatase
MSGEGEPAKPSVLFVCLGNICRSPLAEAAMAEAATERGLDLLVESAGTGDWHIGHPPDSRAQAIAAAHGVDIAGYRARQVTPADFYRFSDIVALDPQNLADLQAMRPPDATASLSLLLDYVPGREGQAVADPYYGEDAGFATTWADVVDGAGRLADLIAQRGESSGKRASGT